ncbi:hypothetical protein H9I45_07575 [Polaribacter haliotis]|uniref:BioF2-like acetyltransferase domain-containing protein n=1 Tax=Polaribacter haliotis TaxID=1888915 RepID=A0A7L8AJX1_9FLAO|nr:hypothetical protein [Polaribacter haliotis]QOD62292.1 hypothetical protein H9I45_07575 [Polaribacter haliotis]
MIQYIKRENLDVLKYDACIENSIQSRIYAFSWYLDIVADNWDVLVLNDYEAVMPLPWKKKYFLKYVAQPYFCQQLGVFSLHNISEEIQASFLNKIPNKFVKISINMNSGNFSSSKMIEKKNYILRLDSSHDKIFKSFSKGRKHAVKVGEKNNLQVKETSIQKLIEIKKEFYNDIIFPEKIIKNIADYVLKNNKGFILGVYNDEVLLGGSLFLKSKNRIIYLFSSNTAEGKKLQAPSFLLNTIIKQHENSNFILDFEGSNIPNVASFFKSFGAENEGYYHLNYIHLLKSIS